MKDVQFIWNAACQTTFTKLKKRLPTAPILRGGNWALPFHISLEDQDKTTLTCPWGTFPYRVLPFGLCNAPATFQRAVIGIFSEIVNDSMDIFMDGFTPYGTLKRH